jgi:hypothetical protein
MDTLLAFAMGAATKGNETMVFDWDKAARIIRDKQPKTAYAGLCGDWEYTGGCIYEEGSPVHEYTYLASTWAVPELILDDEEPIECYLMKHETKWNEKTKWPKSALDILNGKDEEE